MASRNADRHRGSSCAFWLIFAISALLVIMIAGVTFVGAAPAVGLNIMPASPTAHLVSWAPARIAKPTYTPSPVPTSTSTPLPTATSVPEEPPTTGVLLSDVYPASGLDMSVLTAEPESAPAGGPASGGKYILVSISEQHLTAYENNEPIYSFVASTGMRNSTAVGNFSVLDKIPNAYGSTWDIWMANWMGIYYVGTLENGIHALPILPSGAQLWEGYLGTPISFGCVVLAPDAATLLYNWADIGTPVIIVR